jgi:hypothetical protein
MTGLGRMTAPLPPLCGPCLAEMGRWLDTSPSTLIPRLGFAHGSGAAYDASPAGIRDRRAARYEEWRRTVQHGRAMVAVACRAGHHAEPGVDTSQSSL